MISVVVTSRNDDHGGDMLRRMSLFVTSLAAQAKRHALRVEIVVVEWNPPTDRPRLSEVLPSIAPSDSLELRYIQVPHGIHERLGCREDLGVPQWFAKNIGIRRARGEFVLVTNMDILFSDEVCKVLAQTELLPSCFYRANRCDVSKDVLSIGGAEEQLEFCKENVLARYGFVPRSRSKIYAVAKALKHKMRSSEARRRAALAAVDVHACGDFFMMSRNAWGLIKGYPEINSHAYVDGLACHAASACGLQQVVFPPEACVYHIDHAGGWMSMSIMEKIQMMDRKPTMDAALCGEAIDWMHANNSPLPVNDEKWGCADEIFDEIGCRK